MTLVLAQAQVGRDAGQERWMTNDESQGKGNRNEGKEGTACSSMIARNWKTKI